MIDVEALEAEAYSEVEGVELDGDTAVPTNDEAGANLKDGAESESPTDELEDSMPVDDDSSDDGDDEGDAENSTLTEGDEEAEDTDEQEKLTVATASKRIASAQAKMHTATAEAAQLKKERDSLMAMKQELESKYQQLQAEVDEGKALRSDEKRIRGLIEKLPDHLKEYVSINPEFAEIILALKDDKPEKADRQSRAPEINGVTPEQQAWMDGVLDTCPDFLEDRNTKEFADFLSAKKQLVSAINARFDNLDPRGAQKLHANFLKYKQELATTKKPQTTDRVSGRSVTQPSGNATSRPRSRQSIEEEFEKSL